jgi:hypothetical protein
VDFIILIIFTIEAPSFFEPFDIVLEDGNGVQRVFIEILKVLNKNKYEHVEENESNQNDEANKEERGEC